jgi:hypothetical protein
MLTLTCYIRWLRLLVVVVALALTTATTHAQSADSQTFTFPDGTVVTLPEGWGLVESASTETSFMLSREVSFITVTHFAAADLAELEGDDPALAAMQALFTFGDGAALDATTVEVIEVNGAGVLRFEFTDLATTTLLFGAELDNGTVLVMTGLPRGTLDPVENATLAMLVSVPLNGGRAPLPPDVDPADAVPATPYFPTPEGEFADLIDVIGPLPTVLALSDTDFSDGTELRFPLGWEINRVPDVPDFIEFRVGGGQLFVDLYIPADMDELGVETMQELMARSYIPFDDTAFVYDPAEIWTVTYDERHLFFYRYEDGYPGTQMAIGLDNGSVLIIDTWNVPPQDPAETLAFAMLLDAAGATELLDAAAE